MTECEIAEAAELFGGTNQAFVAWLATRPELDRAGTAVQLNAFSAHKAAEAEIARCHAITGHGPAVPNRIAELEDTNHACLLVPLPAVPSRVERLEAYNHGLFHRVQALERQLATMTAERDHALLRMEVAIATSNGLIDVEVKRRIAEATAVACRDEQCRSAGRCMAAPLPCSAARFPDNALRHQSQPIGLLSTADSGRVRLGGYAPTLPPR